MKRALLFIAACVLGGIGGALGSAAGHGFGKRGLWIGGVLGGVVASMLIARLAVRLRWIDRSQSWPTVVGTVIGFFAAAAVAAKTLSSPIGPVMSTLLIGIGALIGASRAPIATDLDDRH